MTQQDDVTNELDAAKAIVETLKSLEKPQQERALRFASETLGLQLPTAHVAPNVPPPAGHLAAPALAPPTLERGLNIKQFSEAKAPKSDNQFAAVVAYYYRFEAPPEQRRDTINADVLANAARLVVRTRPGKFTLVNAKNQGYLDPVGDGEYRISTVGENLVAITLPGNVGEGSGARAKKSRRTGVRKVRKKK